MSSIIKFIPFQSKADPSFWMKLGDVKLNHIRLTEDPIDIEGKFTLHSTIVHRTTTVDQNVDIGNIHISTVIPGRMRFDQDSIKEIDSDSTDATQNNENTIGNENVITQGKIHILNTLESFKTTDKNELLNKYCLGALLEACGVDSQSDVDASSEEVDASTGVNSSIQALTSFYCLCHLDLKAHKVLYWFAFPVLSPAPGHPIRYASETKFPPQCALKDAWGQDKLLQLEQAIYQLRISCTDYCFPPYFMVVPFSSSNDEGELSAGVRCFHLSYQNYISLSEQEKQECCFAFLDVTSNILSNDEKEPVPVGWTLRNLIAYVALKLGLNGCVQFISYRPSVIRRINIEKEYAFVPDTAKDNSLLLQVQIPSYDDYKWPNKQERESSYTCVGWELNARNKPGPRSVNLAPLLSPSHLAQQATDLNLKLMKWRMIPNLNLEMLSNLRVLLLGAGTLGCSVARTLLGML